MKELVIDGNVWGRGHSSEPLSSRARLCVVQADGVERQCCIEILGRSLGQHDSCYSQIARAAGLPFDFNWQDFYLINDARDTPDTQRAEELRVLFRDIGYELKFVNVPGVDGYPLEGEV